ncbi:MAG: Hsp20/alpha crystallin family protein [Luteolibacter sp.]
MNLIQRYQPDISWISELDRFFDRGLRNPGTYQQPREAFHESEDAWIIRLDLPGFAKEEVSLTVTDNILKLDAETPPDRPFGGKFERRWKLGEAIDQSALSARLENGVLEVRLAKKTPVEEKPITINIQ